MKKGSGEVKILEGSRQYGLRQGQIHNSGLERVQRWGYKRWRSYPAPTWFAFSVVQLRSLGREQALLTQMAKDEKTVARWKKDQAVLKEREDKQRAKEQALQARMEKENQKIAEREAKAVARAAEREAKARAKAAEKAAKAAEREAQRRKKAEEKEAAKTAKRKAAEMSAEGAIPPAASTQSAAAQEAVAHDATVEDAAAGGATSHDAPAQDATDETAGPPAVAGPPEESTEPASKRRKTKASMQQAPI